MVQKKKQAKAPKGDATKGQIRQLEAEIRSLRKLVVSGARSGRTFRAPVRAPSLRPHGGVIEKEMEEHANILMDPCMAPLPRPLPGNDGATVGRYMCSHTGLTVNVSSTYAVFLWRPTYVNAASFLRTTAAAVVVDSLALAGNTTTMPAAPFYTPLGANFRSHRVMGACLKATYTGKELDSTGMAYSFYTQADVQPEATCGELRGMAQNRIVPKRGLPVVAKYIPNVAEANLGQIRPAHEALDDLPSIGLVLPTMGLAALPWEIEVFLVLESMPNDQSGQMLPLPTENKIHPADILKVLPAAKNFLFKEGHPTHAEKEIESAYKVGKEVFKVGKAFSHLLL